MDHFQQQIYRFEWNHDLKIEDCPVLTVAHGTFLKIAEKIIVSGFASLSTLDQGFYGKGMYFSSSAIYTFPYCSTYQDPCIMICFILPGNPYPTIEHPRNTKNLVGHHIITGYQNHYVVTRRTGFPFEKDEYLGTSKKYNEIVIDQEAQVVPIFLIELDKSNFEIVSKHYHRDEISAILLTIDSIPKPDEEEIPKRVFPIDSISKPDEEEIPTRVFPTDSISSSDESGEDQRLNFKLQNSDLYALYNV